MTKQEIFAQFGLSDAVEILPFGEGHINDTFLVTAADGKQYVLQRINHVVFPHPEEVMENIFAVTHHIRKKITAEGGDPTRKTLHYRKTKDGALCYFDGEGYTTLSAMPKPIRPWNPRSCCATRQWHSDCSRSDWQIFRQTNCTK